MRVSKIEYARLQSDGEYGHDRISVVVDLEENDCPVKALKRAKAFVQGTLDRLQLLRSTDIERDRIFVETPPEWASEAEIARRRRRIEEFDAAASGEERPFQ